MKTRATEFLALFRGGATVSVERAAREGFTRDYFTRSVRQGAITRIASGIYIAPGHADPETAGYAWIASFCPHGVFCLQSALRLHRLTDENPSRYHVALPPQTRSPKTALPVDYHHFGAGTHAEGITEVRLGGAAVRVYSIEKTIADCFRFRNQIGTDVAIHALREALARGSVDRHRLCDYALGSRVFDVMRPYLETAQWA